MIFYDFEILIIIQKKKTRKKKTKIFFGVDFLLTSKYFDNFVNFRHFWDVFYSYFNYVVILRLFTEIFNHFSSNINETQSFFIPIILQREKNLEFLIGFFFYGHAINFRRQLISHHALTGMQVRQKSRPQEQQQLIFCKIFQKCSTWASIYQL